MKKIYVGTKMEKAGDSISNVGKKLLPVTAGVTALGSSAVKTASKSMISSS